MGKNEIAARLQKARESAGKTQDDAAQVLGTSFQRISNWERGVSRIDTESLAILCDFYGVSITWVISGKENEEHSDIMELRETLRRRPGMRLLFSAAKDVTEEDLLKVVKMVEVFKEKS
jgi:transcriptional regulator with XRE-family HTH domain